MNKTYYCPLDDFTCPYYNREKCACTMENPKDECDDYYAFNEDDDN